MYHRLNAAPILDTMIRTAVDKSDLAKAIATREEMIAAPHVFPLATSMRREVVKTGLQATNRSQASLSNSKYNPMCEPLSSSLIIRLFCSLDVTHVGSETESIGV